MSAASAARTVVTHPEPQSHHSLPVFKVLGEPRKNLLERLVRVRLIVSVTTFFAATLVAFYAGGRAGLREGFAFYIWIGLINGRAFRP